MVPMRGLPRKQDLISSVREPRRLTTVGVYAMTVLITLCLAFVVGLIALGAVSEPNRWDQ